MKYEQLCELQGQADAEIQRDVGRTFPERFDEALQQALFRVLRAVSHRVEDIGYCQGMNFIAGVMLCVFRSGGNSAAEPIAYHCVLSMLLRHGMNQYFGDGFPKLRLSALQFDCLLEAYLPDLAATFDRFNISAEFYATQWFLTLFAYSLPFPQLLRVWDQFLCRGMKFIHRVGLALLTEARPALLGQSFDCTIQRLRCLCQSSQLSPEALVKAALNFKVTNRLLSDLEQAITTPATSSGRGTLPCCFLERDLDRGTTHCRFLPSREGSVRDGSPKSRPAKVVDLAFLEATLPAPRVPADPLVPGPRSPEPAPKGPNAASGATSQLKSFARKSQKVFSKVRPPSVTLGLHRGPGKDAGNTSKAPAGQIRSVGATPAAPPPGKEVGRQSRASSVPIRSSGRFGRRDGPAAFAEVPEAAPVEPFSPPPRRPWGFSSLRSGRRQNSPRQR